MSETPIKGVKKYQTISVEKGFRTAFSTTANRLTQRRKSNSVLANPQSILATPLPQIQDLSLPKIQQKRKTKKQGTFLQSWLDQALGAPDPLLNQKPRQQQRVESNILKTLKKYELDKRHLQSQNIPSQKVQKLYQSLYIYTHGVNHIFQQLIKIGKDFEYPDLVGNFWRAYTKLLESCTSYQTVFQKVQKDHLLNIRHLRANIEKRAQQFLLQRKQWENKISKLQKSLQEKDSKYTQLNADFEVIQNTLQLTDEAFNQQVNLRLKFEEKINAVYTCYEELKSKYAKLVEDMQIKNIDLLEGQNKQNELKNLLSVEKTKVQELMFLLKVEQDRVKQRQTEIIIKNQELEDATALVQARSNEEDRTHDRMQEYLSRFKSLQSKLIEVQNVVKGQKLTIKQQEEQINKLSKSLESHKDQNNQIYIKYSNSGKKVVQLQSKIQQRNMKITELQKLSIQKGGEAKDLARELQHIKEERQNLRNQLSTATKSLKNTQDTMNKNNIILDELKAVKDKYERINDYLKIEIKQLQSAHNKSMEDLRVKTQQLEGMKLLLDNRNKALNQAQKAIQQERQLNKIKVSALNAAIAKKQALTKEYQKKSEEQYKIILNFKSQMKLLQEKNIILQSLKMKLQVELGRKIKLLADLEDVLNKQNIKFKQLNKVLEGQLTQKSNINSKLASTQFVLKTKNEEQRVEVQSLTLLLSEYKARLIETSQYIHPMVYQQALQIARRCEFNESKSKKQEEELKKQVSTLLQKIKGLETELGMALSKITEMQKKIKRLTQQKAKQNEQKMKLQQKCKKIENNLSQMTKNHEKQSKNGKKLTLQIEQLKKIEKDNKQKIESLQSQLSNTKSMLQKLVGQRKKTSRAETRQVKREKEIKKEIKQIKQQQTQTQFIQESKNRVETKKQTEKQEIKIQKEDKSIQTDLMQQIIETQRQIFEPYNHEIKKEGVENTLIRKQKQDSGQRKIENKQFKRALKLTYMRR